MRRPLLVTGLLAGLAVALLGACGSGEAGDRGTTTTEAAAPVTGSIAGREWVLDADESSIDLPDGASATLRVEGGTVSGIGPCNSYRGSIQVDGSSVIIGSLAETMMACERPLLDAQSDFTAALRAVDTAEVDGDTLV
ncbi:MAG TPA: META domain-containing protein, partial [Acidimicrobiales bacterium]|nr:META domain-containing protein [Acidimicrobiales bacterium]